MTRNALLSPHIDPVLLLVEPRDGLTDLAGRLVDAGLAFDHLETADGAESTADADLLVVAARSLEAADLDALRRQIGVAADVPVLVVAESASARVPAEDETGAALATWPLSRAALEALVRGLARIPVESVDRFRARSPSGATPAALYEEVAAAATAALEAARAGEPPELGGARLLAERIHSQLLRGNGLVLRSLEPHEEFDLARHSANVAIIAGKMGLGMALGVEDVIRVILAGIIHDVGMARLPTDLVRKPGRLTDEEREAVRTHPMLGAELFVDVEERYRWIEPIILQEHERMHGQGYPAGLVGPAIDPLAQIIGLADVFEALSHPRSYRSPYTALEALEQVSEMKGEYFEAGIVAALVNEISAFPLDSFVQLSTGEIAQVVGTNPENILRPEVLVRWDSEWTVLSQPKRLDLADNPGVTVARALLEAELPIT
jgi:HD-GYP domain-containing protein (c-di-GMP phosphodiesterase class II)